MLERINFTEALNGAYVKVEVEVAFFNLNLNFLSFNNRGFEYIIPELHPFVIAERDRLYDSQ